MTKKTKKTKASRTFATSFKDLLKQSEVEAPAAQTKAQTKAQAKVQTSSKQPARPATQKPAQESIYEIPISDAALFEKALDGMSRENVFAGKYVGEGHNVPKAPKRDVAPEPVIASEEEEQAREAVESLREEAFFAHMVGDVAPMSRVKNYYVAQPRTALLNPEEAPRRGFTDEHPETLYTPLLPKDGDGLHVVHELDSSQKGLLKRFQLQHRRERCPQLDLHGDTQEDALRRLELFSHQAWKDRQPYIKIIHGKGIGNPDSEPVLKPTVLHWLEGPGLRYIRGYAPELNADRTYGSLVVAIDVKRQNPKP